MSAGSGSTDGRSTGVLLVNLGSPDAPRTREVRRYLREFLSDPRVIDVHPVSRAILLYLFILPFRPSKSAEAYRKIWTNQGSPLIVHSRNLRDRIAERLAGIPVELAMRYGKPPVERGLRRLADQGVERVVVFPLYPQYAESTTESVMDAVLEAAPRVWDVPDLVVVPPFYEHVGFLEAFAATGREALADFVPDHVLMSYHGLPERQIRKLDPTGRHCLVDPACCERVGEANRRCYRAHCYATSRGLARHLELGPGDYSVSFQSRLGRTPWIRPYTDEVLAELPGRGVERVAVFCPSFVADCLETLEEIGMRGRDTFLEAGGKELRMIPSLNAQPAWADAATDLIRLALEQGERT